MAESIVNIDKFLGENVSLSGDTNLLNGELSICENAKITQEMKIRKREGYKELFPSIPTSEYGVSGIYGQWHGKINGKYYHLFVCDRYLYKRVGNANIELGFISFNGKANIFYFGTKVYVMSGVEYKSFDGTTFENVVGYVPKIFIGTPAAGGGTAYENINLLNGKKHQTFNADGIAKDFKIAEREVNSIDAVYVNKVLMTLTTDYTRDYFTGIVSFVVVPTVGQDNVDIYWTKGEGSRNEVTFNEKAITFGGVNDTRVHLYGNGSNKIVFSGLADGVPSAEYFPALNTSVIGSAQYPITSIIKQYDKMIITSEKASYYSSYDFSNGIASFPVYPLNDNAGSWCQGQLIQNNPFIVKDKIIEIIATGVRDERNTVDVSKRIQPLLDLENMQDSLTFDYEELREFWLCISNKIYIYNYGNNTWYHYTLKDIPTSFIVIDGILFMGTKNSQLMEWAKYNKINVIPKYLDDNGTPIRCKVATGFMDGDVSYKRKFLNFAWVAMKPETKALCNIEWESDYDASTESELIDYSLLDFENIDFANFSFMVNYNPQPFRIKLKAKKYTYLKIILTNNSVTETMTVLSINLPMIIGGNTK